MTSLFQDMLLWEIILLLLGILLFLTIMGGFIFLIKKDKLKTSYGAFFLFPIIMIAFPAIRYVNFMNGLFEFNTLTEKAEENPEDETIIKKLEEKINEESNSWIRNEEELLLLARANTILKHYEKAETQVEELLEKKPEDEEVKVIKARIEVAKAQEQLEKDSSNLQARQKIETNIKVLQRQTRISKFDEILIGKAEKIRLKN